jgi:hypothetical protein
LKTTAKKKITWDSLSASAQKVIAQGAADYHALKTERRDYNHWKGVALAVQALRDNAMKLSGQTGRNDVRDNLYRATVNILLDDPKAGALKELHEKKYKPTLFHLHWWADNLPAVDQWFAKPENAEFRLTLNHPTSIWRRHPLGQALKKEETAGTKLTKAKKQRAAADAVEETKARAEQLGETVKDLTEQLEKTRAYAGRAYDLSADCAEESVDNFVNDHLSQYGREVMIDWANKLLTRLQAIQPPEPEPTAPEPTPQPKRRRSTKKATKPAAQPTVVAQPAPKPAERRAEGKAIVEPAPETLAGLAKQGNTLAGWADMIIKTPAATTVIEKAEPQYNKDQRAAMRRTVEHYWDHSQGQYRASDYAGLTGWELNNTVLGLLVEVAREKDPTAIASDIGRKLGLTVATVVQHWH